MNIIRFCCYSLNPITNYQLKSNPIDFRIVSHNQQFQILTARIMIKTLIKLIFIIVILSLSAATQDEQTANIESFKIELNTNNKVHQQIFQDVDINKQIAVTFNNQNMYSIQHKEAIQRKDDQYCKLTISQHDQLQENKHKQLKVCNITFSKDLCIIEKPTKKITITVECLVEQCKGTFGIFQTSESHLNPGQQKVLDSGIFAIPASENKLHRTIRIFCQALDCELRQQIQVFSDNTVYSKFQNLEDNQVLLSYPQIQGHIFLVFGDKLKDEISVSLVQQKKSLLPLQQSLNYVPIDYTYSVSLCNYDNIDGYLNLELLVESVEIVDLLGQSQFNIEITQIDQTSVLKQVIPIEQQFMPFHYLHPNFKANNNLTLSIKSTTNNLFLKVRFSNNPFHSVSQFGQTLHFSVQKDKQIKFKYSTVSIAQNKDGHKVKFTYDQQTQTKIRQNQQNCEFNNNMKHCQFSILALIECHFCTIKFEEQFGQRFFGKNFKLMLPKNKYQNIDPSQTIYLYYELKDNEIISITVQTQEVLMYSIIDPQTCPNEHAVIESIQKRTQKEAQKAAQKVAQIAAQKAAQIATQKYINFLPPGSDCFLEVGNFQNPIIVKNVMGATEIVFLAVKSATQKPIIINLNTIGQKYIPLFAETPASYKIDPNMDSISFLYTHQAHGKDFDDLNVNLVGPLHQLKLAVYFDKEKVDLQQSDEAIEYSLDGYLTVSKNLFEKNSRIVDGQKVSYLYIKVSAVQALNFLNQEQYTLHFTLIASSKDHALTLMEGQTHYDNLQSQEKQMFNFAFEKTKNYTLNFYIFNFPKQQLIEIDYIIKKMNQVGVKPQQIKDKRKIFKISSSVSSFSLNKQLRHQCTQNSCELAIMIRNPMKLGIDFAITIFSKQSQIHLRDGQWQSYSETLLKESPMHFYYVPISNKTVNLFYKTINNNIRVQYKVHTFSQAEEILLKMRKWPFPKASDSIQQNRRSQRNTRIEQIRQCFPNCMVLISVFEVPQPLIQNIIPEKKIDQKGRSFNNFKIMISTTFVELQQKQLFPMFLQPNNQMYILVDMKYLMDRKYITFFTKYDTGLVEPCIKLYSSKHNQLPSSKINSDFVIDRNQFSLAIKDIKSKKFDNNFEQDEQLYLAILFKTNQQTILSFQYNTEENSQIRTLHIDSYQSVFFQANQREQQRTLQFVPIRNYELRIVRNGKASDAAFIKLIECNQSNGIAKCLSQNRKKSVKGDDNQNGDFYYEGSACLQCVNFVWISSKANTNLTITLQSTNKSIILRQKQTFSSSVKIGGTNYYQIPVLTSKPIFIIVKILAGGIKLVVNAEQNINYKQYFLYSSNTPQSRDIASNVSIQLLPIHQLIHSDSQSSKHRTFSRYFITVKGMNSKQVSKFQIFYSTDQEQRYINQGTIVQQKLLPQMPKKFNFQVFNVDKPVYLTISCQSNDLIMNPFASIEIKIFAYKDMSPSAQKKQFPVEIPYDIKRSHHNNLKLTKTISLPMQFEFYQIIIKNKEMTLPIIAKLMISNGGDIYLPHNQEISWQVQPNQTVSIISQNKIQQHQKFVLRKCDQKKLEIRYGLGIFDIAKSKLAEYSSVKPGIYQISIQNKQQIDESINFFITNRQENHDSTFTFQIVDRTIGEHFQIERDDFSLEYNIKGINKFQILFSKANCYQETGSREKVNCSSSISYYALAVAKKEDLVKMMYCPRHQFFQVQNKKLLQSQLQTKHLTYFKQINPIYNQKQHKLQYPLVLDFLAPVTKQFLGIKAVNQHTNAQFFYQPIQIVNAQGFFDILDTNAIAIIIISFMTLMIGFAFIVTKQARKGYQPITGSLDEDSRTVRH